MLKTQSGVPKMTPKKKVGSHISCLVFGVGDERRNGLHVIKSQWNHRNSIEHPKSEIKYKIDKMLNLPFILTVTCY